MLKIRHVVKTYGKNAAAVTDVSLRVDIVKKPQAIRSRLGIGQALC